VPQVIWWERKAFLMLQIQVHDAETLNPPEKLSISGNRLHFRYRRLPVSHHLITFTIPGGKGWPTSPYIGAYGWPTPHYIRSEKAY